MRISDWSSDVCSSDLLPGAVSIGGVDVGPPATRSEEALQVLEAASGGLQQGAGVDLDGRAVHGIQHRIGHVGRAGNRQQFAAIAQGHGVWSDVVVAAAGSYGRATLGRPDGRSEEDTSELQSLMRISYADFCLKKKKHNTR